MYQKQPPFATFILHLFYNRVIFAELGFKAISIPLQFARTHFTKDLFNPPFPQTYALFPQTVC
jgi:hypothetical protein